MMNKKFVLITLIGISLMFTVVGCTKSKNREIDISNYKSMVEVSLSSGPDFIIVIDKKDKISNIKFLNKDSLVLNDIDIMDKSLSDGILTFMEKLWNDNYFDNEVSIKLICYDDKDISDLIYQELNKSLVILGIKGNILRENSSFDELSKKLDIDYNDDKTFLKYLGEYSRKIISSR